MDLREYLRILRRNWLIVVASCLIGLLIAGVASMATKPTYTSETQLFVAIQNSGSVQELQQGNTFTQSRVQSYVKTTLSPIVLQPVIDSLGLEVTPAELATRVRARTDLNTVLINIAVDDVSPVRASSTADGIARSLINVVETLEKPQGGTNSPVRLSIIAPAASPSLPSAPNTKLNLILGFALGLAAGVAAALVRSTMDTRVRSESSLRNLTDKPLLGTIAFDNASVKDPLVLHADMQTPRAESFRQLRTNLQFANVAGQVRSVLVTSSIPGEGKSTTATNLALTIAQAGQSVCIVDADLRRPRVHSYLGLDRNAGLTTTLVGALDVDELLQPWGGDNLFLLASGQIPPNPSELLGSERMHEVLKRLESVFDMVIVDAPPLLPVTDAAVLSQFVGGVLVVVDAQTARSNEVARALDSLQMVGANVLGVVLNRTPIKDMDAYSYVYSYSSTEARQEDLDHDFESKTGIHADDSVHHQAPQEQEIKEASRFPRNLLPPA